MSSPWPAVSYESWNDTCDTLHAHTQVLGKLAVALAPPEPELQHAVLRLSARGWETNPLPAPDGSGAMVVLLDLRSHEAVVEHSDGRAARIALTPHRSAGSVARDVLGEVARLGGPVRDRPDPPGGVLGRTSRRRRGPRPLRHRPGHRVFEAATQAALVLAEFRAPRGRSTPVNAWWGSFDLATNLFSGKPADPPSDDFIMRNAMDAQEVAVGWWPGDARYPKGGVLRLCAPRTRGVQ